MLVDQLGTAFEMIDVDELLGLYRKAQRVGQGRGRGARGEGGRSGYGAKTRLKPVLRTGRGASQQRAKPLRRYDCGWHSPIDLARSHLDSWARRTGFALRSSGAWTRSTCGC